MTHNTSNVNPDVTPQYLVNALVARIYATAPTEDDATASILLALLLAAKGYARMQEARP